MAEYETKEVQCKDCPKKFTLTAEAQKFFAGKGLKNPVRCGDCRKKKREANGTQKIVSPKPAEAPKSFNHSDKDFIVDVDPTAVEADGARRFSF